AAGQAANVLAQEDMEGRFSMGRQVCLRQVYPRNPPDATVDSAPLFVGRIEGMETAIGPDGETVEILAKDVSAALGRTTVYGQHVVGSEGAPVFLPGLATTFNPGGQGNAAAPATVEGATCTLFNAAAPGAARWSYAEIIHYLLSRHVPGGQVSRPDLEQLRALTENRLARDLDVTGMTLLEALHCCCREAGLTFRFVPCPLETGPAQAIVFYQNARGPTVELSCQQQGEPLKLSRTNIAAMQSERHLYPVTHRYIGQGDFKVYEATFTLVKAWDPALQSTDYGLFSASTNPDFHQVKDVYRQWCLNEAGDYTASPFNQGPAYDFSRLFGTSAYLRRRRRFRPALSTDTQGRSLGYFVEVSFDAGTQWWPYLHAFNNLLDECGIWLSSDQLDVDTWAAALSDTLRFRITASVVSDERLSCIVADGPVGSTAPVVDHLLTLPRRFKYRQVSPQSVLAQKDSVGTGTPDETDDSMALHEFVRQRATASPAVIERIDVQTPSLALHFHPGDTVTSHPESRDLLSCRRDSRSCVWVERVHMDFRNQCTNLHLVRQRV
ncbi:MAG: hypothetical protein JW741_27215, partial [Sedimentisphaerales bacterium]|nr:hypothetical protein [Sedimentisphaerales bacterium]